MIDLEVCFQQENPNKQQKHSDYHLPIWWASLPTILQRDQKTEAPYSKVCGEKKSTLISRIKKVFSSAVQMKILGNKQLEPVLPFKCGLVANVASHLSTFHYFNQLRKSTKTGGSTCIFKLRPLNFFTQSRTDVI